MSWDDSGNKGNPWNSGGDKGPADLDAIVRDLQRKLSGFLGGRGGGGDEAGQGRRSAGGPGSGLVIGAMLLLTGLWGLTGFFQVNAAEIGVVLRFGEFNRQASPGLRWHLPWPIERVELINTNVTERFLYQGSMLTRDENIVLVDLVIQYRRTNPIDYLFNLRTPEETLEDVTASAIREVIGNNDLDFILTSGRTEVAAQTQAVIQSTLDSYGTGFTVFEVNLQEANFPRDVEDSVQDAIRAREDKERVSLEAEAYANDILPNARGAAARQLQDAEGYRARVIADAEGEADRFLQILTEYQKAPAVTRQRLYIETLEEILANSTKVLIDGGEGDGSNNLLYLPLDRLVESRPRQSSTNSVSRVPAGVGSSSNDADSLARLRSRETR
jgi:membrane protease subunit HflK